MQMCLVKPGMPVLLTRIESSKSMQCASLTDDKKHQTSDDLSQRYDAQRHCRVRKMPCDSRSAELMVIVRTFASLLCQVS